MGSFLAEDDAHPGGPGVGPALQVEQAGDLGDPGAGTDLAVGVVGRRPDAVGDQGEPVGDVVGQAKPDLGEPPLGAYDKRWPVSQARNAWLNPTPGGTPACGGRCGSGPSDRAWSRCGARAAAAVPAG